MTTPELGKAPHGRAIRPATAARPGERKFRRKEPDFHQVTLVGVIPRAPLRMGEFLEFTLAGKVRVSSGKVLPWYHKGCVGAGRIDRALLVAGHVVRVVGWLEHHKFGTREEPRSIVRVVAELLQVIAALAEVLTVPGREWQEPSFILDGGVNMVLLAGNRTRQAEQFTAPGGDPYARLNLAVRTGNDGTEVGHDPRARADQDRRVLQGEPAPEATHYFALKAWRDEVAKVGRLKSGARLGVCGVLLSESFPDKMDLKRNSVVIEVVSCRVK